MGEEREEKLHQIRRRPISSGEPHSHSWRPQNQDIRRKGAFCPHWHRGLKNHFKKANCDCNEGGELIAVSEVRWDSRCAIINHITRPAVPGLRMNPLLDIRMIGLLLQN